jgi:hypothetical protein
VALHNEVPKRWKTRIGSTLQHERLYIILTCDLPSRSVTVKCCISSRASCNNCLPDVGLVTSHDGAKAFAIRRRDNSDFGFQSLLPSLQSDVTGRFCLVTSTLAHHPHPLLIPHHQQASNFTTQPCALLCYGAPQTSSYSAVRRLLVIRLRALANIRAKLMAIQ